MEVFSLSLKTSDPGDAVCESHLRAGEDEMRCPSSTVERGRISPSSTLCAVQATRGLDGATHTESTVSGAHLSGNTLTDTPRKSA